MSSPRPAVLTALPDEWDQAVVSGLAGRTDVGRRCVDVADLAAAAEAGLGDVAVLSARLRGLDLSVVRDLRLHGVGVLGVVPTGSDAEEARLRQIGVRDLVPPDAPPADLFAAVVAALPVPRAPRDDDDLPPDEAEVGLEQGQVVCVWGPHGAPGRTTVALNLAAELAEDGHEVLLVDLDTHAASLAQHLAVLDETAGVAAACRAAEHGTLDVQVLGRLAPSVLPRLRVLTGLPGPDRWPELRPGAVERVLGLGALLADVVVVDVGADLEDDEELSYDTSAPRRNMAALTALEVADRVVVVGAADPVGLQRLVRGLQGLEATGAPAERHVVVNRVRASAVGPRPGRRVSDVLERFAGVEDAALVPDDPGAVDAALLAGEALVERHPQAPARLALRALTRMVTSADKSVRGDLTSSEG